MAKRSVAVWVLAGVLAIVYGYDLLNISCWIFCAVVCLFFFSHDL